MAAVLRRPRSHRSGSAGAVTASGRHSGETRDETWRPHGYRRNEKGCRLDEPAPLVLPCLCCVPLCCLTSKCCLESASPCLAGGGLLRRGLRGWRLLSDGLGGGGLAGGGGGGLARRRLLGRGGLSGGGARGASRCRLRRRLAGGRRGPATCHHVLEAGTRAERGDSGLLYLHCLARPRVASHARCADTLLEDAESSDGDLVALGYGCLDLGKHRVERGGSRFLLSQANRERIDQLGLVHEFPPVPK